MHANRDVAGSGVDRAAEPGEFRLPVEGGTLRCRATGSGPPIILLHGNTFDLRLWTHVHQALAAHTVISYDLRGYGRSSVPIGPYSHVADLAAVTAAVTDQPCPVVGLSMGGRIAVDFALAHPDRVSELVLVGSGVGGWIFHGELADVFASVRTATRHDGWARARSIWLASPLLAPTAAFPQAWDMLHRMVGDYSGWHFLHDDPAVPPAPAALSRLHAIAMRTLVLSGTEDMAELAAISDRLARDIPDSRRVWLDGCGHLPPLERPDAFVDTLLYFLDGGVAPH